ncbi:MAG: universal stress protein [Deltaproteobacteria bacterium]|nr:universal stress protein [Deltaproteobacteria bacterium]
MKLPDVRIKKILYATDLSESAVHAFAYAVNLARTYGAGITILHVMAEFPGENFILNMIHTDTWKAIRRRYYAEAREELMDEKRDHLALKDVLQAFSDTIQNGAPNQTFVTDEIIIKTGPTAEMIVETAKKRRCDLIVMGTHGQSALADVLIGSTARWVVRHSTIPVLVIRLPE